MSFAIGDKDSNIVEDMKFSFLEQAEEFLNAHYENVNKALSLPEHNKEFFIYQLNTTHLTNRTDDMYDYEEENIKYTLRDEDTPSVIPELRRVLNRVYKFRRSLYVVCES